MQSIVHLSSRLIVFAIVFKIVVTGKEIRKRKAKLSRFGLAFVRVAAFVLFVLCVLM